VEHGLLLVVPLDLAADDPAFGRLRDLRARWCLRLRPERAAEPPVVLTVMSKITQSDEQIFRTLSASPGRRACRRLAEPRRFMSPPRWTAEHDDLENCASASVLTFTPEPAEVFEQCSDAQRRSHFTRMAHEQVRALHRRLQCAARERRVGEIVSPPSSLPLSSREKATSWRRALTGARTRGTNAERSRPYGDGARVGDT